MRGAESRLEARGLLRRNVHLAPLDGLSDGLLDSRLDSALDGIAQPTVEARKTPNG